MHLSGCEVHVCIQRVYFRPLIILYTQLRSCNYVYCCMYLHSIQYMLFIGCHSVSMIPLCAHVFWGSSISLKRLHCCTCIPPSPNVYCRLTCVNSIPLRANWNVVVTWSNVQIFFPWLLLGEFTFWWAVSPSGWDFTVDEWLVLYYSNSY